MITRTRLQTSSNHTAEPECRNSPLLLDAETRAKLWSHIFTSIEDYIERIVDIPITSGSNAKSIQAILEPFDFREPIDPLYVTDFVIQGLLQHHVHNAHPGYFGLFVPAPTTMGIAGDALTAAFNPVLAAWQLSPVALEIERHLIKAFCVQCGYDRLQCDGLLTSGGSEANHTAILTALVKRFPAFNPFCACIGTNNRSA